MIVKPSFTIGIKESGEIDILKIGSAEDCKDCLLDETKNPSGKYVQLQYYRKPPYSKRRDIKLESEQTQPTKKRGRSKSED